MGASYSRPSPAWKRLELVCPPQPSLVEAEVGVYVLVCERERHILCPQPSHWDPPPQGWHVICIQLSNPGIPFALAIGVPVCGLASDLQSFI